MEEDLTTHLLADAGLRSRVGNRVNWLLRPQASALPAVTLTGVSGERDYHSKGPSGLATNRVQIDAWAGQHLAALEVARLVEAALSGLRAVVGGTNFQGCFLESERQSFEEGAGAVNVYRVSLDFMIHHRRT